MKHKWYRVIQAGVLGAVILGGWSCSGGNNGQTPETTEGNRIDKGGGTQIGDGSQGGRNGSAGGIDGP